MNNGRRIAACLCSAPKHSSCQSFTRSRGMESSASHQGAKAEPDHRELQGAQFAHGRPLAGAAVRGPLPRPPGAADQDAVREPRHGEQPALRHTPCHGSLRAGVGWFWLADALCLVVRLHKQHGGATLATDSVNSGPFADLWRGFVDGLGYGGTQGVTHCKGSFIVLLYIHMAIMCILLPSPAWKKKTLAMVDMRRRPDWRGHRQTCDS